MNYKILISLILGLLSFIYGGYTIFDDIHFFERAKTATAEVQTIRGVGGGGKGGHWILQIRFLTAENKEILTEIENDDANAGGYQKGQNICVFYDPDNGRDARLKQWQSIYFKSILFLFLGSMLFGVGWRKIKSR